MEENILKLFHVMNNTRPPHLQFSDYRLSEIARDICDLFDVNKQILVLESKNLSDEEVNKFKKAWLKLSQTE